MATTFLPFKKLKLFYSVLRKKPRKCHQTGTKFANLLKIAIFTIFTVFVDVLCYVEELRALILLIFTSRFFWESGRSVAFLC